MSNQLFSGPGSSYLPEGMAAADVLTATLAVSLAGLAVYRPVFADDNGELVDFTLEYLNPAAQRLLGLPEQPAVTLRHLEPAAAAASSFQFLHHAFQAGQSAPTKLRHPAAGPAPVHLQMAAQRSGAVLVGSFTEARPLATVAEATLRQSQAREQAARAEAEAAANKLRRVTESLPSTIFTVDEQGQVLYLSPQWYTYTGMTPDEDASQLWASLVHPDDLPAVAQEYGAALAQGRAWSYEFRLRGADGQYRWFASKGIPEPLAEVRAAGRPRQWFGSNLDIEDLKQAELRLAQQEQLLTDILSSLPAGVVTFEAPELRYTFFNDTFQRQVQNRAILGRKLVELFPEAEKQGFVALLEQVLRTGEPIVLQELPSYLEDPLTGVRQPQFTDVAYVPLRHGQQPPYAVLGFSLDATERVHTRQQAEAAQTAAQAAALAAAEQAAAQREAFFRVFEQTPACIGLLRGPGHLFEYVNPAYQQLFPERQLAGLSVAQALPEAMEQGFTALLDQVYQTGQTFFGQEMLLTVAQPNGQPPKNTYYDFSYQAMREEGKIVGISIFATDVTERVLTRQQRAAEQAQLSALFEQAPVAICVFRGSEYVLETVNPVMAEMLGRPRPQLLGQPFFEALPELVDQGLRELLDEVRRTGVSYAVQEQPVQLARHRPGAPGYYNFVYEPLRDEQGQLTGIACVATEVTGLVRARQASEATARQLRLLTDALPVLIGYLDQEQRYQFANRAHQVWFRQQPSDLLGHPVRAVVGEAAYHLVQGHIQRALAGERVDFEAQMPYRPDFTPYIRTTYVPDVRNGQVVGFYTLMSNITEQVLAREQVQHLNEELAAINEELRATNEELTDSNHRLTRTNTDLDNFIYTASYDLKAPISNIEGLLTALRDELVLPSASTEVPPLLHLMQNSVDRFKRTIAQLTDVIKLQQAHDQQLATNVDLGALVEEVRQDLRQEFVDVGAHLTVDVAACPTVPFAEKNLRSIVFNLLSNALKYRSPARPPRLQLRSQRLESYTLLEVQDNGLGLTTHQQNQLFGLFRRLHDHVEGSGIGLYMVKKILDNAGGRIEVDSQPDVGTTFRIFLPTRP